MLSTLVSKSRTHPLSGMVSYIRWFNTTDNTGKHILNLFKINWIHRTGFRPCMIAFESFPNVFTMAGPSILYHLFYSYIRNVRRCVILFRLVIMAEQSWVVKWCHEYAASRLHWRHAIREDIRYSIYINRQFSGYCFRFSTVSTKSYWNHAHHQ